jgi:cation transport regulator ChaC
MSADHHVLAGRPHDDVIWIFGFGSLISHPKIAYAERVEGYVKGWRRVFHQVSLPCGRVEPLCTRVLVNT